MPRLGFLQLVEAGQIMKSFGPLDLLPEGARAQWLRYAPSAVLDLLAGAVASAMAVAPAVTEERFESTIEDWVGLVRAALPRTGIDPSRVRLALTAGLDAGLRPDELLNLATLGRDPAWDAPPPYHSVAPFFRPRPFQPTPEAMWRKMTEALWDSLADDSPLRGAMLGDAVGFGLEECEIDPPSDPRWGLLLFLKANEEEFDLASLKAAMPTWEHEPIREESLRSILYGMLATIAERE